MGSIYVSTTAYNAEKTIRRCVDSILNQTCSDFIYYICDNGSTDQTNEILRAYAEADSRIRLFVNKENNVWDQENEEYTEFRCQLDDNDFICILDADDKYEPTFLDEMLTYIKMNRLDVAVCGSMLVDAVSGNLLGERVLPHQLLLLSPSDFSDAFPIYHQFMRTLWGKLFTGRAARYMHTVKTRPQHLRGLPYGLDTTTMFAILRHTKRVGIMPKALHQYYISQKSSSYKWNPKRIESDQILFNDAINYLSAFGPISPENRSFLQRVYSNAIADTLRVIHSSDLPPENQLHAYKKIAMHPITQATYQKCKFEDANRSRMLFIQYVLKAGITLAGADDTDFRSIMQVLLPRCGKVLTGQNSRLFVNDPKLLQGLLLDDPELLIQRLLELISMKKVTKKFSFPYIFQALAADNLLLCQISDVFFLQQYGNLYWMVWRGEYLEALDEMTGLLIGNYVHKGKEIFLQLYISLSALEGRSEAFLYGKFQLAWLYLQQNQRKQCEAAVSDLMEMGFKSGELSQLQQEMRDKWGEENCDGQNTASNGANPKDLLSAEEI